VCSFKLKNCPKVINLILVLVQIPHLRVVTHQFLLFCRYASLFVITLVLLLSWPTNGVDVLYHFRKLTEFAGTVVGTKSKGGMKEKDEDANYEYEMVWDAEGAMHLIRKGYSKVSSGGPGEVRSTGRLVVG
jgi:hypothetical protein